jgi:hypothetical protein
MANDTELAVSRVTTDQALGIHSRVLYAALVSTDRTSESGPPEMKPLDPPTVPFAVGGIILWAIIGLVLLPFRHSLETHGRSDWLWICLAGFLLGFPGLLTMIRHDRQRRTRHAEGAGISADGGTID